MYVFKTVFYDWNCAQISLIIFSKPETKRFQFSESGKDNQFVQAFLHDSEPNKFGQNNLILCHSQRLFNLFVGCGIPFSQSFIRYLF
jgi:hypothetical protein